jgi:hypothetical protein
MHAASAASSIPPKQHSRTKVAELRSQVKEQRAGVWAATHRIARV